MNPQAKPSETIISVSGLRKAFGHVQALNGVDFTVHRGDIYGFLGPNGSGKSTTIRILLSLVGSDAGSIELFGQSIISSKRESLTKIGALIERPDFYEHFSAFKNLEILSRYSRVELSASRIMDTIALVGLGTRANDKVHAYSDGMKQRLGIAQALMHNPELLILDEPFNSLDPQGVKDIRDLIVNLNKEQGITVLLSSHKLDEIEKVATRMVMIDHGRAIAEGDVQALLSEGRNAIKVEVDSPVQAKHLLEQSGLNISNIDIDGHILTLFSNKDNIPDIIEVLSSAGLKIYGVSDNHTLEELFLSLTSGK